MKKDKSIKKIQIICLALFVISFTIYLGVVLGSSTDEKIEKYFAKNKKSFTLLKNQILNINGNSINKDTGNLLQTAETNPIIDSLKQELDISYIGLSFDENYTRTIHIKVDFHNYIDVFEIWYREVELAEFSDRDQVLSLKKLDDNWGVFRNRRKRGILY